MLLFIVVILPIYACYCTPLMKQEITLWKRNTLLEPFLLTSTQDLARRGKWQPTPVFLPGESCGQRSLVGCHLWVTQSWTWLKLLSMHACIGEGNGNPLQCSCLENPRDRGAWWAAVVWGCTVGHDWSDLAAVAGSSYSILLRSGNSVFFFFKKKNKTRAQSSPISTSVC